MIRNTKKPSTRYIKDSEHNAYGIQNWLLKHGYIVSKHTKYEVDPEAYRELLKEFFASIEGFNYKKHTCDKHYNAYVQNSFRKFCDFTHKNFKSNY